MKRAARIGLALIVILILVGAGARWYLTSRPLANKVALQLAELYGGEVKLDGADVWVGSSSFTGVQLYEKDCPSGGDAVPWLSIREIQTDLSVFDLLGENKTPNRLTFLGAKVLLRFDKEGKLLTCLPEKLTPASAGKPSRIEALPEVQLQDSEITLRKGDVDLVLENVNAKLGKEGDNFVLSGAIESSAWGKWKIGGKAKVGADTFEATLKSESSVRVTPAMLNQVPFIPPSVWGEVKIQGGETPGVLAFNHDLTKGKLHYRVELEPRKTDFTIVAIEMNASNAQGKVTIEDGVVKLRGVSGQAFSGTLRTDADLDFRSDVTYLRFNKIEAATGEGLRVADFPKSWQFPAKITGRLEGNAALEVSLFPQALTPTSRIHTAGTGKGRIVDAKIAGNPTEGPVGLELRPVPGGFGFGVMANEAGRNHRIEPGVLAGLFLAGTTLLPSESVELDSLAVGVPAPVEKVGAASRAALPGPARLAGPTGKEGKSSYFDIDLKMKDLDLASFAKDLEFKLPFDLVGKVSFQVKISIPLDKSGDLKLYKLHGSAQLSDFVLGDLRLEYLETEVEFNDGVLRMPSLKGRMPPDPGLKDATPGTFAGQGTFQIEPLGDLKVSVTVDRIPLGQVAKLGGAEEPVQGDISGTLEATIPGKDLKDPKSWTASAKLSSQRVLAFGWRLEGASAGLRLEKGDLKLDSFQATLEGTSITASAQVELDGAYPFKGKIALKDADLSAFERLAPKWRPPFKVAGRLQTALTLEGTASPLKMNASGITEATDLQVDAFTLKNAYVAWDLQPDRLLLKEVQARLYEGELTGSASIPLGSKAAGAVNIQLKGLDAGALAKSIPGMPIKVQGKVDGQVKGTMPPLLDGKARAVSVQLDLKAPKLRVQNIPTEHLRGAVEYKDGLLDYRLEGKSLGGTFELKGQVPSAGDEKKEADKGRLEINGVQIDRLLDALGMGEGAWAYRGAVRLEMNLGHTPGDTWPEGTGRLRISNLRYKDVLLAADVAGDLVLTNRALRLRNFSTTFGEGVIRAQANLNFKRFDLSWFSINMDRVEVSQLLGAWFGDTVTGRLQARIRGKLGREWTGTADLEMGHARVAGLEIRQWRMPLHFRYAPDEGRGQIDVYETTAQSGAGRLTGKVSFGWGYAARIEGQLRFFRINVETFLRQTFGPTKVAGGMLTGRFDFAGREMRSLNDVTGNLEASFEQSQALNLPVLSQISPFLGINPSTTFQKGDVRARLGNGFFRVERLELAGNNASIFAEGTVSLAGRLDLDVLASTVNFGLDPRLRLLGLRIPAVGPVPLVLAVQAADLLSNRVIQLRVTGTTRSPNIRVLPLATLTQGGIRFFLDRATGSVPFSP